MSCRSLSSHIKDFDFAWAHAHTLTIYKNFALSSSTSLCLHNCVSIVSSFLPPSSWLSVHPLFLVTQPSVSATLFHFTQSQNVESLLRGEAVTAEQFLCLWPISCPLIELQLLIKMSESSAFWGPEALFNPLRLLFTLTLPLHPLPPVLFA